MDYSEFLAEVKVLRSKATYEGYCAALKHFPNPTKENILKFIESDKYSSSTKKERLRVLAAALRWYNKMDRGIERVIKGYRENKTVEPCPTKEQVELAWNQLGNNRDRAMFALMAYNGLRIGEVYNLDRSDVDIEHHILVVRGTKGKRDAIIPLVHPRVQKYLYAWMTESDARNKALFVGPNGRLSYGYLKHKFQDVFRGIGMEFHAHSLRRFFANSMYSEGASLQDMCMAMRHANVSTTMRYLNIGQQNVIATLQRTFAGATA